jgi:hypothetical protein
MGAEDKLVLLAREMIKYASKHSFQGERQDADLLGFCELNRKYSLLEKKLYASSHYPPLADKWDMSRNKIVTYITQKFNDMPSNSSILADAWLLIAEPYVHSLADKVRLRKAL